ncbi:hypothetical protein ABE504_26650 [Paenibacillus oryzisoli]|uniref:hypothetical protein n=1 Tax=Paenibacillus oryzisoli TaxID=1850517 RepID=UPI003D2A05CC
MGLLFFDMLRNKVDMKKAEAAVKRAGKQDNKRFREEHTFADRQITVSTKSELQDAVEKRYGSIIASGDLAEHVSMAYKVKNKLVSLEKAPTPTTAGTLVGTGITETVIIVAIIALTVVLVVALLKNYDIDTDVQVTNEQGELEPKIKLRLKK